MARERRTDVWLIRLYFVPAAPVVSVYLWVPGAAPLAGREVDAACSGGRRVCVTVSRSRACREGLIRGRRATKTRRPRLEGQGPPPGSVLASPALILQERGGHLRRQRLPRQPRPLWKWRPLSVQAPSVPTRPSSARGAAGRWAVQSLLSWVRSCARLLSPGRLPLGRAHVWV